MPADPQPATSETYRQFTSVGSKGDSYDNAMAEAFNSLFKAELVRNRGPWRGINDRRPSRSRLAMEEARSRGGLTTKVHLVADGRGRALSMAITGGNINDTTMMTTVLGCISVPRVGGGRPRVRPDRVLADKGYPSKANRAWLREHGIAATIPERDDQIAHRRRRPGRPIDFGPEQRERYRGRNVVERCFGKLKQWRSDKTARKYHAGICLAAILPLARHQL